MMIVEIPGQYQVDGGRKFRIRVALDVTRAGTLPFQVIKNKSKRTLLRNGFVTLEAFPVEGAGAK